MIKKCNKKIATTKSPIHKPCSTHFKASWMLPCTTQRLKFLARNFGRLIVLLFWRFEVERVAWKWKITKGGFSAFCSSNIHFIPEQRSARNFHHFFEKIYNSRRSATRSARKGLTSASSPPPGKEGHNSSRPCCWYKFKLCPLVVFSHFAVLIKGVLL